MALPSSGAISFSQINTELGLSSSAQMSLSNTMFCGLSGKNSASQISVTEVYSSTGKKSPYLANVYSRLVMGTPGGVANNSFPCFTNFLTALGVGRANTLQAFYNTTANTEANNYYSILAQVAAPAGPGIPAAGGTLLGNLNESYTTGVTASVRYVPTANAVAMNGADYYENFSSADSLEALRVNGGLPVNQYANAKVSQIQTRAISEYNQYLAGTRNDTNYVAAGFLLS